MESIITKNNNIEYELSVPKSIRVKARNKPASLDLRIICIWLVYVTKYKKKKVRKKPHLFLKT
tara:strand:+ start:750 stop:938 length:189 start_codon:yes stop_codon:yes gene_type:complete